MSTMMRKKQQYRLAKTAPPSTGTQPPSKSGSRVASTVALFDERATINKLEGYLREDPEPDNVNDDVDEERDDTDEDGQDEDDDDEYESDNSEEYDDMIEKVSQKLVQTETQLRRTQGRLKEWNGKVQSLENQLEKKDHEVRDITQENRALRLEVDRLQNGIVERDEGRARPELESRLRKAVEFLKKDLTSSQDKCVASQAEVKSHQAKIELLEDRIESQLATIRLLENKHKSKDEQLLQTTKELNEVREEASSLTEEVSTVRDELSRAQKMAEEKENMMKRDIANRVKEKIRLEVREELTKEITDRTSRQVRAELKVEKDKEVNALREQFKKVFMEYTKLKKQVDTSADATSQVRKLEERDIPAFKAEIERLVSILDETKETHEVAMADLESYYRTKIQSLKEEAAKEKWEHATEIRKQMGKDREREANDFTQRIEALSMQTDRLLQRAEREKEEYADQVRKRISHEKQREIQSLMDKLASLTKDSDELLQEAANDKEAYADQIRQQLTEEKNREVSKLSYRIEVLTSEKETLLKRISAFEEELSWAWNEQEKNIEQMKSSQSALKSSEDDIFKLKRKNQSLAAMAEQYKKSYEEATEELLATKERFRGSILASEDTSFTLTERLKQLEEELEGARKDYSDAMNELEDTRSSLFESSKAYEERIDELIRANQDKYFESSPGVDEMLLSLEAENTRLKVHLNEIGIIGYRNNEGMEVYGDQTSMAGQAMHGGGRYDATKEETQSDENHESSVQDSMQSLQAEISQLKNTICEQDNLLKQYKATSMESEKNFAQLDQNLRTTMNNLESKEAEVAGLRETLADTQTENAQLTRDVANLESSLNACKEELARVSNELNASNTATKSMQENEIEAALLRNELSRMKARLECCRCKTQPGGLNAEKSEIAPVCNDSATASSVETERLNHDIQNLEEMILEQRQAATSQCMEDTSSEGIEVEREDTLVPSNDIALKNLNRKVESLTESLEAKEMERIMAEETTDELREEIHVLTEQIEGMAESLNAAVEERSRAMDHLSSVQEENGTLLEKVHEMTGKLSECKGEVSRTSQELEESKTTMAADRELASQLQQRVERLTLILETSDRNRSKDSFVLEDTKKRLDESLEEVEDLQSEVERLTNLLSSAQEELEELDSIRQQSQSSRLHLEQALREAESTSNALDETNKEIQSKLETLQKDNEKAKKELLHSKRLFHEALMKSEKTIFQLNEKIQSMSNATENSQQELQEFAQRYQASNEELQAALQSAEERYNEKVKELKGYLESANGDNERLKTELRSLEHDFGLATRDFENEKSKFEKENRKLRNNLNSCNEENLEVAKELQHSRQLFKEALIAWRVETRDLTQQLNMWRRSEHIVGSTNPRDSFSVQSLSQTDHDRSINEGSACGIVPQEHLKDRGIKATSKSQVPEPSPRGFFSNLLAVDTGTDDETTVAESPAHRADGPGTFFASTKRKQVTWKEGARWDLDDSSQSDRTSKSSQRHNSRVLVNTSLSDEPFDEADELKIESPTHQMDESREGESSSSSNFSNGIPPDEESRDGLPGDVNNSQLPPRQPNKNLNKQIIQKLLDAESRDDVQSRDGSFFSYSSVSNDSRRSYSDHRLQSHRSPFLVSSTEDDEQTINSTSSSLSSIRKTSAAGTLRYHQAMEKSSLKSWSPKHLELFSMQVPEEASSVYKTLQRQQRLHDELKDSETIPPSKPVPFDEQTQEQRDSETPFDEEIPNWWQHQQHQSHQQFIASSFSVDNDASTIGNSTIGSTDQQPSSNGMGSEGFAPFRR